MQDFSVLFSEIVEGGTLPQTAKSNSLTCEFWRIRDQILEIHPHSNILGGIGEGLVSTVADPLAKYSLMRKTFPATPEFSMSI